MTKTNIILFILFTFVLAGVGYFYLGYYGYEEKVTSEDIRKNVNQMFPFETKSTAGMFKLNKIEELEIHEDKMAFIKISYTLKALNNFVYTGDFYLQGEILDSLESGVVSIRNIKLLRSSIDDSKRPLQVRFLKSIDYAIQTYVIDKYFQYRQIFNFQESLKRKIMFKLLKEMTIEDDYIHLKFGL